MFRRGQLVLFSEPYAISVQEQSIKELCSYCFRNSDRLKSCDDCQTFYYCGKECKEKDSPAHWVECEVSKTKNLEDVAVRLLVRMCLRYHHELGKESSEVVFGRSRTIHDLLTHQEKVTHKESADYWAIVKTAKSYVSAVCDIDYDLLFLMVNKIAINSHDVICPRRWTIGRVVYLGASILNHSCEVHDRYSQQFVGRNYVIRALRDITIDGVDDLDISYIPLMMSVHDRREKLKDDYYFDCWCSRCTQELRRPPPKSDKALETRILKQLDEYEGTDCEQRYRDMVKLFASLSHLGDSNFYKYRVLCNILFRCTELGRLEEALYIAQRMISASISIAEMEVVLDRLCVLMRLLRWHEQNHRKFQDYLFYIKVAARYFRDARGIHDGIAKEYGMLLRQAALRTCASSSK